MKSKHYRILMFGLITWILCNNLWLFFGAKTYYIGTALIILCSAYILNDITTIAKRKIITLFFLFASFNNLVDELFLDPTKFQLNEYLTAILYLTYLTWKNLKSSRNG